MIDLTNFPNSATGNAADRGQSRFASPGVQAADIASEIAATGVPVLPTPPAELTDTLSYSGVLAAGSYTRADILTLVGGGATKVLSLTLTGVTGTTDFTQGGTLDNLAVGDKVEREYHPGFAVDDFTINVDAASTASIEVRAI